MQPLNRRLFLFCLASTALAGSVSGQDDQPLLGTWNMTSETGDDTTPWILTLKKVEGKLTASADVGDGEEPVKDLTASEGELKFKVTYQGTDYDIALKATADKLSGTWSGSGESGKTSGIRK